MSEKTRFTLFLLTSGAAAGVNVAARALLSEVTIYEVAVVLAYVVGMTTAFVLTRQFVFEQTIGSVHAQFVRFAIVNAAAAAQVWFVSVGLARLIFPIIDFTLHPETVAHLIGVASPALTSYVLHKRFSFRVPSP